MALTRLAQDMINEFPAVTNAQDILDIIMPMLNKPEVDPHVGYEIYRYTATVRELFSYGW